MADWQHLIALEKQHLWHPFTPMQDWCAPEHVPLMLVSGQGCVLRDQNGREYLDGNSSIWTNIHGHNHPTITAAITKQLHTVAHTSFLGFTHPPAIELAKQLVDLFPGGKLTRVFYSDNGSTAIEAGVRMALQYWKQNGAPQRDTVLSFDRAYHGDTLGAASLGGLPALKGSGNDFGYNVVRVASMEALDQIDASRLAVVIIEPLIQGAAGMRVWPQGMLKQLESWCRANDVLLMLDEVMTGFGRTGKMFACLHEDVVPDIIAMAKGITGGYLPLAATLTTERLFASFLAPGTRSTTATATRRTKPVARRHWRACRCLRTSVCSNCCRRRWSSSRVRSICSARIRRSRKCGKSDSSRASKCAARNSLAHGSA